MVTHQLLKNLEVWLKEPYNDNLAPVWKDFLWVITSELIKRDIPRIFSHGMFMTDSECTIQGHTIIARHTPISPRFELKDASNPAWLVTSTLVDELALEYESSEQLDRRMYKKYDQPGGLPRYETCPYLLITTQGPSVDPDTMEPTLCFRKSYGKIPMNIACPPCEVTRESDLTKFGLPPM
jgi:hypothetical protein